MKTQIEPPTYKKSPFVLQFHEMAADWRRGNDASRANGAKKSNTLPVVLLDTAIRAGQTHEQIRAALGISSNTLSKAISRAGLKMPKSAAERTAFLESAPVALDKVPLAEPHGIVSAWLAADVPGIKIDTFPIDASESSSQSIGLPKGKQKFKTHQIAEAVARRLAGCDAETLVPGTYTARTGEERCDGLIGKGPEATPTVFAWRGKALEVEEILRLCREIQDGSSGDGTMP